MGGVYVPHFSILIIPHKSKKSCSSINLVGDHDGGRSMYEVGEIPMGSREVVRDKENKKMTLERSLTLGPTLIMGFQKEEPAVFHPSLFANERGKRDLLELDEVSPLVGGGG